MHWESRGGRELWARIKKKITCTCSSQGDSCVSYCSSWLYSLKLMQMFTVLPQWSDNCKQLFTMRLLVRLCLQESQNCSKVRFEAYWRTSMARVYHSNIVLMKMFEKLIFIPFSGSNFFTFSLNFLPFSFCSSKELNEEAGPKGERGRNLLGTAMPPNPPSQGMWDSWMSVGSSCERRGLKSLSQRSPGCWAMNGVNCLLRRNGYY